MEGFLRFPKLSLQPSDGCPETLDNLLDLLGLISNHSLIFTSRRLQLTDPVRKKLLQLLHCII